VATRAEGEAQAAATLAVGQAEAEAMDKRAEAFAHYNDAAVLQMLIEVLPQIAREVAAPIAAIDQLTVVSSEGAGALPRLVNDNVVQTVNMLKTSTGLDLQALIQSSVNKAVETASDEQDDTGQKRP
jgi:flotillin